MELACQPAALGLVACRGNAIRAIAAAGKALYAAGADIVLDSVASLVPRVGNSIWPNIQSSSTDTSECPGTFWTPGPLTTSSETKAAMLSDWGSWDSCVQCTDRIRMFAI